MVELETVQDDILKKCYDPMSSKVNEDDYNEFMEPVFSDFDEAGAYMGFNGDKCLSWSLNDYLGLRNDPRIKNATLNAAQRWGVGAPIGSRLLTGNSSWHIKLENELAAYFKKPAAFISASGYLSVIGAITALVRRGDTIILDKLSHSCIVDAAIIAQYTSGQKIRRFRHNDMNDLEEQLKEVRQRQKGGILIITEGVFGTHGTLGKLNEICQLKQKYGARLFVDDAHGTGLMGENGLGTGEHFSVHDDIDIYFKSFSKAFCSMGGMILADHEVAKFIRMHGRQTMMTRGLPLTTIFQLLETLNIIKSEIKERRNILREISKRLQETLLNHGFVIASIETPLTSLLISDYKNACFVIKNLREKHKIFLAGYTHPAVPHGKNILKLVPTANHTKNDVDRTLEALISMKDLFNVN